MKAWRLDRVGGSLNFKDIAVPEVRPGSVLVRIEASALMSYLKAYVEGKLPAYNPPKGAFTLGSNGVGVVHAIGQDVWHLKPGERVVLSPHLVAPENVEEPAQILIGLTAFGPGAERLQADWRDGTLAEYALMPSANVTPADGLSDVDPAHLVVVTRYIVPFGGLLRGRLAAGGARVAPVVLTGDIQKDVGALRAAANGGAQMAFDMVGQARDPNATLAALRSLRRGGRLVLMGSMSAPLPLSYMELMVNNWEIMGQFMYPADAYRRLLGLVRAGLLDISAIRPRVFPLSALPEAMEAGAAASSLECVVVQL
jgi:alcohol dehydrogenase